MDPGGAIAPVVHLGCLRLPRRGAARMRRRWPHSAPETCLPHSPDAWQPGMPIRTRTTRMSGASGGVIAFWPRARPSGSAEADRLLRRVTEGSEDHRSDASARTGRGTLAQFLNRIVSEWAARSG